VPKLKNSSLQILLAVGSTAWPAEYPDDEELGRGIEFEWLQEALSGLSRPSGKDGPSDKRSMAGSMQSIHHELIMPHLIRPASKGAAVERGAGKLHQQGSNHSRRLRPVPQCEQLAAYLRS